MSVTTGTITTSTSKVNCSIGNAAHIIVSLSGTFTGINVTFEASDDGGTTYYPVLARRWFDDTPELTSGTLSAARVWYLHVPFFTNFQVRATAFSTGSGSVRITTGSQRVTSRRLPDFISANSLATA